MKNFRGDCSIGVVGLGYVGLPLALEFSKKYSVVGFDISKERVLELSNSVDRTAEVDFDELSKADNILFTYSLKDLSSCGIFIVTVPTPITNDRQPDLRPLLSACELVGSVMKEGSIVVFESTVYPGVTEEVCVPCLERASGLTYNDSFYCGYSPERINPGDRTRRLKDIVKITSGSNEAVATKVDQLYASIIEAGTHKASSIRVAEAAKVIENTQRDVNIALMNELSMVFHRMNIDTQEVLSAAGTKWNFLPFQPGLVGGHCIGIDPYYLAHAAQKVNYNPEIILSGRRVNESMPQIIAMNIVKKMMQKGIGPTSCNVLVMGLTFKENCPDIRNSKVFDLIGELSSYGLEVDAYDPWVQISDLPVGAPLKFISNLNECCYDAIIISVPHEIFKELGSEAIKKIAASPSIIVDLKSTFGCEFPDYKL